MWIYMHVCCPQVTFSKPNINGTSCTCVVPNTCSRQQQEQNLVKRQKKKKKKRENEENKSGLEIKKAQGVINELLEFIFQ